MFNDEELLNSPAGYRLQKTLIDEVRLSGVGIHSGEKAEVRILPAPVNTGIVFERVDLPSMVPLLAHFDAVVATERATTLGSGPTRIATVEHLMAALFAMGVTNAKVQVVGSEVPIMDGSAKPFVDAIMSVGMLGQSYTNRVLRVIRPIKIFQDGAVCEILPRERLRLTTSVDFAHPRIGRQTFALEMTPAAFLEHVAPARTFGFLRDAEALKKNQLARGASLDNVLAYSDTDVLNPEGPRFADECVRHKLLDAVGDLALIGCWIEGEMVSFRGGHSIHRALLRAIKAHPTHIQVFEPQPLAAPRLTVVSKRSVQVQRD